MEDSSGRTRLSRRSFVRLGSVGLLTSVAGCLGSGETDQESNPDAREDGLAAQSSLVQAIGFEGQDIVVRLVDGHDISKLNLLDPEGSLYTSTSVATGETTVRLQIIEIPSVMGRYSHYTPGTHELALISDGSISDTVAIDLNPDLEITEVKQYRNGKFDQEYAKIEVTVHNSGTGPTWVSDIVFEDSPYFAANHDLRGHSSIPTYTEPETPEKILIPSDGDQTYVPDEEALLFSTNEHSGCANLSGQIGIIAGLADGNNVRATAQFDAGGKIEQGRYGRRYSCTEVQLDLIEEDSDG
ncbi:hypothetical protein [Halorientalis halophila]|uniref:hypothetical protein n=1 Tax=Halorientalis halophila TaxID=3108499 RepID=UPI00300A4EDC